MNVFFLNNNWLSFQHLKNSCLNITNIFWWFEKVDNLTFIVNYKLSKIPWNHLSLTSLFVIQFTIISQKCEKWMSIVTINFNFFKNREFSMEIFLNKFNNLFWRSTFLTKELIAWESKDFKSLLFKFLMHLNHGLIVRWCQSSLTCYIDNHYCFFVFESGEINQFSSDIFNFEIKERLISAW